MNRSLLALALLLAAGASNPVSAQGGGDAAVLAGRVTSAITGRPVDGAQVVVREAGIGALTDSAGYFRIADLAPGIHTLEVHHIGFDGAAAELALEAGTVTEVRIVLEEAVLRIDGIRVTVDRGSTGRLAGFEARRRRGRGYFITPEEIERRTPRQPSDLLRTVPGVTVTRSTLGKAAVLISRGAFDCEPTIFLDGKRTRALHIDDLNPWDITAIELYRGVSEIPAEFSQSAGNCGVIVVWTKVPGSRTGGSPDAGP